MIRSRGAPAWRLYRTLLVACAAGLACAPRPPAAPAPAPRNVILILLDTLRSDHLSSYGYSRPTSPNLDAFGRENARFEQVRSQAACTFPSVNSILTSRPGFDFLGQPRSRVGIPPRFPTLAQLSLAHGMRTVAISASPIVRRTTSEFNYAGGFDRGFETFDETCYQRRADCINRRARRYLNHQLANPNEPFLLYLHYMDAHSLYDPPAPFDTRFVAPYEGPEWVKAGNPRPLVDSIAGKGPKVSVSKADLQHLVDLYDGEIAYMDSQLGELLADLRRRGLFESSIIVIAADHGEEFLEHGFIMHCHNVFESTIRVPLFVHVPGLSGQAPFKGLVQNLDILPTLLDYLGIPAPASLEGRSLRGVLEGKPVDARLAFSMQNQLRAVTDGHDKLVLDLATGREQLFDLAADAAETVDAASRSRSTFHALHTELASWLQRTEGSVSGARSLEISEEARKRLEALGYLR